MAAIMEGTRYASKKFRSASGDVISSPWQIKPGDLILIENTDGTIYVINYKNQKQPINYAGFMAYYKANDAEPFANVKTVTEDVGYSFPNGELITDQTPPAMIEAPAGTTKSNISKYFFWGLIGLAVIMVAMKLRSKKGK